MSQATHPRNPSSFAECKNFDTCTYHKMGYVLVHCPEHPACDAKGYVMKHRIVMENYLGRYLNGVEVVHHIDGNKENNDISNLSLFANHSDHLKHHHENSPAHRMAKDPQFLALAKDPNVSQSQAALSFGCHPHTIQNAITLAGIEWVSAAVKEIPEQSVREALQGTTTLEAAQKLGVSHGWIRMHYPHLLKKRVSPGFLDAHKDEIRNLAKSQTLMGIAEKYHTSATVVKKALMRWSKEDGSQDALVPRRYRGPDKQQRERTGYIAAALRRKLASAQKG